MAIRINEVRIAGNLGADPERRTVQSGDAVTNFSLAVTERWKDRETGEGKERTEWVRCVAFGQPAEFLTQYGKKGDNVYVEGRLETRSYDKDGDKRYVTEVRCSNVQLASRMNEAAQGRGAETHAREDEFPSAQAMTAAGDQGNQRPASGRENSGRL